MVIGAVGPIVVPASTELTGSVVFIEVFVAEVVSIIDEAIVVAGMITINHLLAATMPTVAVKYPSKHNIWAC